MDSEDFEVDSPGELIRGFDGRLTFRPNPLPPKLLLDNKLVAAVSRASNTLGRLDGTARTLPDPRILIRSFIRREAQLSSYIENTYAQYDEVAAAEEQEASQPLPQQVRETLNAERTINAGVRAVVEQGQPVSNALIRHLHSMLLAGVEGDEVRGRFRDRQVFIGSKLAGVDAARFVPPPPHLLRDLMGDFGDYLSTDDGLPPLVRLGLMHYQFETIHPFQDGNGRLGRTLILLGLCQEGLLTVPVLNASLYFERNRQDYYDRLLRVSTHGDWHGWLCFFLEGIVVAATETDAKLAELLALQRRYHEIVRSAGRSALLLTIIDQLFNRPVITIPQVQKLLNITYKSAKNNMEKLQAADLVEPVPNTYPAQFVAREILTALNPIPTRR